MKCAWDDEEDLRCDPNGEAITDYKGDIICCGGEDCDSEATTVLEEVPFNEEKLMGMKFRKTFAAFKITACIRKASEGWSRVEKKEQKRGISDARAFVMQKMQNTALCNKRFQKDGKWTCGHRENGKKCYFALRERDLVPREKVDTTEIPCQWKDDCRFKNNLRNPCRFKHDSDDSGKSKSREHVTHTTGNRERNPPLPTSSKGPVFGAEVMGIKTAAPNAWKRDGSGSQQLQKILGINQSEKKPEGVVKISGFDQFTATSLVAILKREGVKNVSIEF